MSKRPDQREQLKNAGADKKSDKGYLNISGIEARDLAIARANKKHLDIGSELDKVILERLDNKRRQYVPEAFSTPSHPLDDRPEEAKPASSPGNEAANSHAVNRSAAAREQEPGS